MFQGWITTCKYMLFACHMHVHVDLVCMLTCMLNVYYDMHKYMCIQANEVSTAGLWY